MGTIERETTLVSRGVPPAVGISADPESQADFPPLRVETASAPRSTEVIPNRNFVEL
jgi:hypothetical protein